MFEMNCRSFQSGSCTFAQSWGIINDEKLQVLFPSSAAFDFCLYGIGINLSFCALQKRAVSYYPRSCVRVWNPHVMSEHIREETNLFDSHTLHRSSFTLWPISRNLILYASLRGQYITVVYGYEMSVELNTLAISPPASSLFLAGHLGGGAESFIYFSSVVSSHWVGNEKCHFQMFVFTSFKFVFIICSLSLTVSVFSPVVSSLFWNLRLLKRFFLFIFAASTASLVSSDLF